MKVVYLEETKSGGNIDIRKRCVEGYSTILFHWEFVAKIHKGGTKVVRKMWFHAKAMVLESIHKCCIKGNVIHQFNFKRLTF